MRKLLAIFFLTLFTIQVLPLPIIGKLLSQGTLTEEVQDNMDHGQGKLLKGTDFLLCNDDLRISNLLFNTKVAAFIHRADALPAVHVAAMPSPPPDVLFA